MGLSASAKAMFISLFSLVGIGTLFVACGGTANQTPTQTPLVIIVTGETPDGSNPSPTSDIFPTPQVCQAQVVEQSFENGRMFWIANTLESRCLPEQSFELGTGEIWVAIFDESGRGGEWIIFPDDWDSSSDDPDDPSLEAPEGLFQPARGFGKVWREKLSAAQREAIGWANTTEFGFFTDYRYEAGGFIDSENNFISRPGLHELISFGDERLFFDEPSLTFDLIPTEE